MARNHFWPIAEERDKRKEEYRMILIYGKDLFNNEQIQKLEEYFKNDELKWISADQLNEPIEELLKPDAAAQTEDADTKTADSTSEPMPLVYISGKDRKELEAVLDWMEENGFHDLFLATQTEANVKWNFRELLKEMEAEQAYFNKRKRLENLIEQADQERMKIEPKYQQAVMTCFNMLQQPEFPDRLLDMAIAMLEAANQDI